MAAEYRTRTPDVLQRELADKHGHYTGKGEAPTATAARALVNKDNKVILDVGGRDSLSPSDVGLSHINDTADLDKPISSATQAALDAKQDLLVGALGLRVDSDSLVNGRMADPDFIYNPSNTLNSRIPNFYYDATHGWMDYLNPSGAAPTSGLAVQFFVAPATGTVTVTLPVRLPVGVASTGQFRLFASTQNLGSILASQIVTLTSTVQLLSVSFAATAGTTYAVGAFLNNSGQCKALTGTLKVSCAGTTGTLLDAAFKRVAFRPSEINGRVTLQSSYPQLTLQTCSAASVRFFTNATAIIIEGTSSIYSAYASLSTIGVFVDGVLNQTVTLNPATSGHIQQVQITLPAGFKEVTLTNGGQSRPSSTVIGAWVRAVYAPANKFVRVLPVVKQPRRIAVYGDSITTGANATNIHSSSAWAIVRNSGRADVQVEAFGYRALFDDTAAGIVSAFRAYNPTDIYIAIGTNDYGIPKQSAANFGTAYGALVDALHAAFPGAAIYAQTPLVRSSEPANSYGDNLGAYRTAISNLTGSRSWLTVIDGSTLVAVGDLPDGLHPGDLGHGILAASVFSNLGL